MISDEYTENLFLSKDLGKSWAPYSQPITIGAFYGSAYSSYHDMPIIIVCGPNGADIAFGEGSSWENVSTQNLWTADLLGSGVGWLMGQDGTIMKIRILKK